MITDYYELKEAFGILRSIAERIDTIRKIRETYGIVDDMTVVDLEQFLYNRYSKIEKELLEKIDNHETANILRDTQPNR